MSLNIMCQTYFCVGGVSSDTTIKVQAPYN